MKTATSMPVRTTRCRRSKPPGGSWRCATDLVRIKRRWRRWFSAGGPACTACPSATRGRSGLRRRPDQEHRPQPRHGRFARRPTAAAGESSGTHPQEQVAMSKSGILDALRNEERSLRSQLVAIQRAIEAIEGSVPQAAGRGRDEGGQGGRQAQAHDERGAAQGRRRADAQVLGIAPRGQGAGASGAGVTLGRRPRRRLAIARWPRPERRRPSFASAPGALAVWTRQHGHPPDHHIIAHSVLDWYPGPATPRCPPFGASASVRRSERGPTLRRVGPRRNRFSGRPLNYKTPRRNRRDTVPAPPSDRIACVATGPAPLGG